MSRQYDDVDVIYFIVREKFDRSPAQILAELVGEAAGSFGEWQEVATFEFSSLYQIERAN